jgi:glycosyltransferase involved in cell wall biosynthesis
MHPLVSILIPCHNAEKWICNAIDSALEQEWSPKEIIVIDDGSTDNSTAILRNYSGRVKVVSRQNRGGNVTRNELLTLAEGEWIQFLDADDYLLPGKIAHQIDLLRQQPTTRVIYAPLIIEHHDETDAVSSSVWDPHDPHGDHDPWAYHLGWNLTQTGGALFHRQTLLDIGGWNEKQPCCQDNELFYRLLKAGAQFARCPQPEAVYRRFATGSVSTSNQQRLLAAILDLLASGETFLRQKQALTQRRLQAVNQLRLNLARKEWIRSRTHAATIMRTIRASDPHFQPTPADFAPPLYRKAFRLLGFHGAEWLSLWNRTYFRK